MKSRRFNILVFLVGIVIFIFLQLLDKTSNVIAQSSGTIKRVSIASNGTPANGWSKSPSISADGRYIAFVSNANNLVVGDTNNETDVFLHDQLTGETILISASYNGSVGNYGSYSPSISADGRYVVFTSEATNLVPPPPTIYWRRHIYVRDLQKGETTLISISPSGVPGNGHSFQPSISADGNYVAFASDASNLVSNDTNQTDIFLYERQTGQITRVSVSSDGTQGNNFGSTYPSISADGRYVAFESTSTNLVIGDTSDTNNANDIFVHNRDTGTTTRVSVASDDTQGNSNSYDPSISADGRYVAFSSWATNFVEGDTNDRLDVFVHELSTGQTTRVSVASDGTQGIGSSGDPAISADGRYVSFSAFALNFGGTTGYEDVFVRDRQMSQTRRISVAPNSTAADGSSYSPSISAGGGYVAFWSGADNLISDDTGMDDVFVYQQAPIIGQPPIAPSNLQATAIDSTHIRLDWNDNSDNETGFYIEDGNIFVSTVETNTTSYIVGGLVSNSYHCYHIYAFNDFGNSGWTDWACATTLPPVSNVDLSIESVEPVQVLEGQDLVKGKATAIKVVVRKEGIGIANNIPVQINYNSSNYTRFYVADLDNINRDGNYSLKRDNSLYPFNFKADEVTKTLYFFHDSFAPNNNTFQISAKVDHLGLISETDETNNIKTSGILPVYDVVWTNWPNSSLLSNLHIHYFRSDWENTNITVFDNYYQYSNEFLRGVYPVSEQRFAPSKSTIYTANSNNSHFRGDDGKFNAEELTWWMNWLAALAIYVRPQADRHIAVVPEGWFANNTTVNAYGVRCSHCNMIIAEARKSPQPNGSSVPAHELGHTYGLHTECEDYYYQDAACKEKERRNAPPDRIGEPAAKGLWVQKMIPIQIPTVRKIYSFMGSYTDTVTFWAEVNDYKDLLRGRNITSSSSLVSMANTQVILAKGVFYDSGAVTLDNWYVLPEAELSTLLPGPYSFEYQNSSGSVLYKQSFDISFDFMGTTLSEAPFTFSLPYVEGIAKIVIKKDGIFLGEKNVSSNAPSVKVITPNGGEKISSYETVIHWSANDSDGDSLAYTVLFSPDNGITWIPIDMDVITANYRWDTTQLSSGTQYLVKVIASDGFNTAVDVSNAPFEIGHQGSVYLPIILKNITG